MSAAIFNYTIERKKEKKLEESVTIVCKACACGKPQLTESSWVLLTVLCFQCIFIPSSWYCQGHRHAGRIELEFSRKWQPQRRDEKERCSSITLKVADLI